MAQDEPLGEIERIAKEAWHECPVKGKLQGLVKQLRESAEECRRCAEERTCFSTLAEQVDLVLEVWQGIAELQVKIRDFYEGEEDNKGDEAR